MERESLPVVVIGAGPVGLAAAAHLLERGLEPLVVERGDRVAASVAEWGHVRLFSPWRYVVDRAAGDLLRRRGWVEPDPEAYPTGDELRKRYLEPLAALPEMAARLRLQAEVVAVTRDGLDKMTSRHRADTPFAVTVRSTDGEDETVLARAVIDASGTWTRPNPLGAAGRPAVGERLLADQITYGIPDVLGTARDRFAGKRVLVVGSGHSAFNMLLDLVDLAADALRTDIVWAIRRSAAGNLFGGGINDALPARGELGSRVQELVRAGRLRLVTGTKIARLERTADGIVASGPDTMLPAVDEIVVATGFRPDLAMLTEIRLGLDPAVEAPIALAPMIDPNLHSCGSVPPHGAEELRHPEPDFYIAGMKSYGRAPTFLLLTGYEQVRSVAAAIAGDWAAAQDVQLVLPETGVCSTMAVLGERGVSCCGTEAEASAVPGACCGGSAESVSVSAGSCCGDAAPQLIQLSRITRGGC